MFGLFDMMFWSSALLRVLGAIRISTGKSCNILEIQCPEPEGACISINNVSRFTTVHSFKMCDGQADCKDGWDEIDDNCPDCYGLQCANETCIPAGWVCDGEEDCEGGEDEIFQCPPCRRCQGLEICLPNDWVCDGIPDCEDKSDEELCSNGEVSVNGKDSANDDPMLQSCDGIRCPGGFCATYSTFTCNGINDCGDWSDERGCPCEEGMIDCGRCIPSDWWCDSFPDCPYDEDEKNCTTQSEHPDDHTKFTIPEDAVRSRPAAYDVKYRPRDQLTPLQLKLARKQIIKSRAVLKMKFLKHSH